MRLPVLRLLTLPFALPSPGGAILVMVLLSTRRRQKHAATSGAFFELFFLGYQRTKICIRGADQVGWIVGQAQFSRFDDLHSPLRVLHSLVYHSGRDGGSGH